MAKNPNYRIFQHISDVDISEQDIYDYLPEVLDLLLIDHTMSAKARSEANDHTRVVNIFWATNDYEDSIKDENDNVIVEGYRYSDEIKAENITGLHQRIVMPRVLKDRELQAARSKEKAEVFTPSWVCNAQNNLIDEAWFGHPNVFNREFIAEDGTHQWEPTEGKIIFPEDDKQKTWKKYVSDNRMEITCGEAPYLVSRYDTTTGEPIPVNRRIGLLDRKFRVINENVETEAEWYRMAEKALKSTYGYELQGDNLLLAREAVLYTYIEYYLVRFNHDTDEDGNLIVENVPDKKYIRNAARWISWNLWQMDGIRMVVPDTCHDEIFEAPPKQYSLFDEPEEAPEPIIKKCPGCQPGGSVFQHNGEYCLIRDWNLKKPKNYVFKPGEDPKSSPWQKIKFVNLLVNNAATEEIDEAEETEEEQ